MRNLHQEVGAPGVSVGTAHLDLQGKCLTADAAFGDLLGYTQKELTGVLFGTLFQSVNTDIDAAQRVRLCSREIPYYSLEGTAVRRNGEVFPARVVFTVASNGTAPDTSLLAVMQDLLPLRNAQTAFHESEAARHELARRLTNAQEEERTRIARELHDDIGQSLAILRIQMLRSGQPVSGVIGKHHPTMPELCDNLRNITDRVSRLSHQLHSSELEYLGLAVAVQSHCREFSEKFKIPVACACQNVPGNLDALLALTLLRVVEEALHNAAKHSKANSIQVTLQCSETELSLLIVDDGVGFDLEEARLAAGLGLISMRERIHLAHGKFKIDSTPGTGTRITANVPISLNESAAESDPVTAQSANSD